MRYNVATLLREPIGSTRSYDLDDWAILDGTREPVRGQVQFVRTRNGVLVRARWQLAVTEACARCLRDVRVPLTIEFEEECVPTIDVLTGAPVPVPEGSEDAYRIDEHHELDLTEAVANYTQLGRPMSALCRDDCPGICAGCGADLVAGEQHQCRGDAVDERWAKLLDFHVR